MSVNIGPPRVRGELCSGDLELGVDPEILRWLQKPFLYNRVTGEYFTIVKLNKRTGEMNLRAVIWNASPWTQGSA